MTTRPAIGTHSVSGFWPALDGPAAFRRAPFRCHAARARAASVTSPDLTTSLSAFGGSHSTLIRRSALTHTCQCPAEDPTNGLEGIGDHSGLESGSTIYGGGAVATLLVVASPFAVVCVHGASKLRRLRPWRPVRVMARRQRPGAWVAPTRNPLILGRDFSRSISAGHHAC
jgi:hypothetical protein